MTIPSADPFALFRTWLGEWEKLANEHGSELLAKPEVAQAMQQMTTAKLQMQAATDAQMEKLLSAANVASKADIEALGTRLAAVEGALARIEGHLRGTSPQPSAKPGPRRTRKPPG